MNQRRRFIWSTSPCGSSNTSWHRALLLRNRNKKTCRGCYNVGIPTPQSFLIKSNHRHDSCNAIGFLTQPARLDRLPGWHNATAPSFAYHGDDGRIYSNSNYSLKDYAGSYGKGDTIGCGVIYGDSIEGTIFYTRNGTPQGILLRKIRVHSSSGYKLIV